MKYLLLLLLFTGCVAIPTTPVTIGPPPTREQSAQLVNEYIKTALVDPYSVRDLVIEPPVQTGPRWLIGFWYNAKNRMGGYVGRQHWHVMISNGAIDWPAQRSDEFWKGVAEGVANG